MKSIFAGLPGRYSILHRLSPDQFVELMRRLMSLRFRMKRIPRRMKLVTESSSIVVGFDIIKMADNLLTEILKYIRIHGRRPEWILKRLSG